MNGRLCLLVSHGKVDPALPWAMPVYSLLIRIRETPASEEAPWHAVQQGICSWIHSSMADFKYLAGGRAGIAMGLAESPQLTCTRL